MLVVPLVAWGKHHVAMAKYCIASLTSAGNLPDVESRLMIYTDRPEAFPGHDAISITLDERQKHHITAQCYEHAMSFGYPIVPVAADMVCSVGMLAAIEKHVATKRLVMIPVLRADAKKMIEALPLYDGTISLSSRELCQVGFDRIHPLQRGMFRESMMENATPTSIFRQDGNTIVARCFHMHPIMMRGFGDDLATRCVKSGIDGTIVDSVPPQDIHVVTDSDEMVVFDLSTADYDWAPDWRRRQVDALRWARTKTNKTHRWFFTHECYLHAGEKTKLPRDPWIENLCEKLKEWH